MKPPSERSYVIGAAPEADIRVDLPTVSSTHARLTRVGRAYVLEDLDSSAGTFVDGNRIQHQTVDSSSEISLGRKYVTTLDALLRLAGSEPSVEEPLVDEETWLIGAAEDVAIRIDAPAVSSLHASLIRRGSEFVLRDNQSTNGTYVGGERIDECAIDAASQITFGRKMAPTTLAALLNLAARGRASPSDAERPPQSVHDVGRDLRPEQAGSAHPEVETIAVGTQMIMIGRDAQSDVRIDDSRVSGRHARVFSNCGRLIIEDAGSANGTYVDGERVSWRMLTEASVVEIGPRRLRFERERAPVRRDGAYLDVRGVVVEVRDSGTGAPLRLVEDLWLSALPGEIIGVMGPAGSGKTTALNAITGFAPPKAGAVVRINGEPLYEPSRTIDPRLAPSIGYAPQDDVVHELLTVEEAVRFSALLRSPPAVGAQEIDRRVEEAIRSVGLLERRNVKVGSVNAKFLSGGQRKRVNIALELVTNPPLLLLDEPTSGLSSQDAAELMTLLRGLASEGRTIILTIHQPSYPMFVQMDRVLLMERGKTVYFGPTAVNAFEYFGVAERQAGAILERLASGGPEEGRSWAEHFRSSEARSRAVEARAKALDAEPPKPLRHGGVRTGFAALAVLVQRALLLKLRDRFFWIVAIVVPVIVAGLFVAVMKTQLNGDSSWFTKATLEHNYLVVLTIMVCFFGALSSCLEVFSERAILKRERRTGLSVGTYIASKAVLYAIPAVTHPALSLLVIISFGGALSGSFGSYFVVLAPAFFASACAGLALSAMLASAEGVIGLAVAYAIVQTIFSAFAPMSVATGPGATHAWLDVAAMPVTARWTLAGLVTRSDLCREGAVSSSALANGQLAQCKLKFYRDHAITPVASVEDRTDARRLWASVGANGALSLLALAGAALLLRRRTSDN